MPNLPCLKERMIAMHSAAAYKTKSIHHDGKDVSLRLGKG